MKSNGKTKTCSFLVETEFMGFMFDVSQIMRVKCKQVIPLCTETSTVVALPWSVGDANAYSLAHTFPGYFVRPLLLSELFTLVSRKIYECTQLVEEVWNSSSLAPGNSTAYREMGKLCTLSFTAIKRRKYLESDPNSVFAI
jgi:hypothetical protein